MSALGTELKINVHVEPIDGLHMSEYDFECVFFVYKNRPLLGIHYCFLGGCGDGGL